MNRSASATNRSQTNDASPSSGMKLTDLPKKRKKEGKGRQACKKSKSNNNNNNNNKNNADGGDDDDSDSSITTTIVVAPPKRKGGGAKKTTKRQKVVTGYNLFIKEQLPIARAKSGQTHLRSIVPMVAKKWNNLPLAKRQPYHDAAKKLTEKLRQQQARHQQQQQKKQQDAKSCTGRVKGEHLAAMAQDDSSDDESEEDEEEESPAVPLLLPHGRRARHQAAAALEEIDDNEEEDDDDQVETLERNTSTATTTNKQRGKRVPAPRGAKKKMTRPYYMSAYNIFVQEQLPFAREDFGEDVHLQFIIPHVAQAWRNMSEHLRERYHEQSRLWKEQDQKYEEDSEEESDEDDNENVDNPGVSQSSLGRRRSSRASPPTDIFGFSDGLRAPVVSGLLGNITNTGHGRTRSRVARSIQDDHKQQRANNLKKPPSNNDFSPYKIPKGYTEPLEEYFEDFDLESDAFLLDAAVDSLCLLQDTHSFHNSNTNNNVPPPPVPHGAKSRNAENGNRKKKIPAKKRVGDTFGTHSSDTSDSSPLSQDSPVSLDHDSVRSTNPGSDDTDGENRVGSRATYWKHTRGQVQQEAADIAQAVAASSFTRPRGRPPVGAVFCTRTGQYLPHNTTTSK